MNLFAKLEYQPSKMVNIARELTTIIEDTKKDSVHPEISMSEWETFISQHEIETPIHESMCVTGFSKIPWKWDQNRETGAIKVFLYYVDSSHVTADETSVTSPKLFGNWWAPVEDISITFDKDSNLTVIEFMPKDRKFFPVLIRSGEKVDPHSMFFLGLLSMKYSKEYFYQWNAMAAKLNEPNAQNYLGRVCIGDNNIREAMHWLSLCCLNHAIEIAAVDLSILLIKDEINPVLAENLLCGLCRSGNTYGFVELGKLYLTGCGEVPKIVDKGIDLLTVASEFYHNDEATSVLQTYNKMHPFGEIEIADIAISSGVVFFTGIGIYYLFKKIFSRKK